MPAPAYIRTVARKDLAPVRELIVTTWHDTYDHLYGADRVDAITADWHSPAALEQRLHLPHSEFILADDGAAILGICFAELEEKTIMLRQLYVLPSAQGRGVGRLLLEEIVNCFDEATAIELEVEPENERAVAFYRHFGFRLTGHTQDCGAQGSGIPAAIYRRDL